MTTKVHLKKKTSPFDVVIFIEEVSSKKVEKLCLILKIFIWIAHVSSKMGGELRVSWAGVSAHLPHIIALLRCVQPNENMLKRLY